MNVRSSRKKTLAFVAALGLVLVIAVVIRRISPPDAEHMPGSSTTSPPTVLDLPKVADSNATPPSEAISKKDPNLSEGSVGLTIHGRVLDESGRPLKGASVQIQDSGEAGAVIRKVDTDRRGAFRFLSVPDRLYALTVNLIGFVEYKSVERIRALPEPSPSLTVVLRSGWTLTGNVVARNGKPVPMALIAVHEGTQGYHTYSKEDGSFAVVGIDSRAKKMQAAAGIDTLKCTAEGYAPAFLEDVVPMGHVTVFLDEPGHLEIHVKVANCSVREGFSWSVFRKLLTGPYASRNIGRTMKHGPSSTVKDLTPGTYEVIVTSIGYRNTVFKGVNVTRGETTRIEAALIPKD